MVEDIIEGISGALSNIASGLVDLVLSLVGKIISIVLYPINALFETFLPDLSNMITYYSEFLSIMVAMPINYVLHLFPPVTRSIILLWFFILISYYSIIWVYRGIILVPKIINKIKFW